MSNLESHTVPNHDPPPYVSEAWDGEPHFLLLEASSSSTVAAPTDANGGTASPAERSDSEDWELVPGAMARDLGVTLDTKLTVPTSDSGVPSRQLHTYEPLESSDYLRLVNILPPSTSATDSTVSCTITEHSRAGVPPFTAISYTWGNADRTKEVSTADGVFLPVTENCFAALRSARSPTQIMSVWIDAISINQHDHEERSSQVARMGDTFGRASQTLIYLGEPNRQWWPLIDALLDDGMGQVGPAFQFCWPVISQCAWFARTWAIQELLLSRNTLFRLGGCDMPLWFVQRHLIKRDLERETVGAAYVLNLQKNLNRDYGKGRLVDDDFDPEDIEPRPSGTDASKPVQTISLPYWRLFDILVATRSSGCADQRDKLFAILPLFQPPIPKRLVPAYSKSVEEVYADLTWFFLDSDVADTFSAVTKVHPTDPLPSWVIDWRLAPVAAPLRDSAPMNTWKAGFNEGHRHLFSRREEKRMVVRGRIIGRIRLVGTHPIDFTSSDFTIQARTMQECVRDWERALVRAAESQPAIASSDPDEVFGWDRKTLGDMVSRLSALEAFNDAIDVVTATARKSALQSCIRSLIMSDTRSVADDSDPDSAMATLSDLELFERAFQPEFAANPSTVSQASELAIKRCDGRRFLMSTHGACGIGPAHMKSGDCVCVLLGMHLPFVMRRSGDNWTLIGECLMAGFMHGEAVTDLDWDAIDSGKLVEHLQEFSIS